MEDIKINVKVKLAALWTSLTLLFAYVDIIGGYKPGFVEEIISGEVAGMEINQTWMLVVIAMMSVPCLMVALSVLLKPQLSRWANIIVAALFIVIQTGSLFIDENWAYYIYGSIVEVTLLLLIIKTAWNWPKKES